MHLQALEPHTQALQKKTKKPADTIKSQPSSEAPYELRLALDGCLFKMEHHPMEVLDSPCRIINQAYNLANLVKHRSLMI